jgi:hypothetical protein
VIYQVVFYNSKGTSAGQLPLLPPPVPASLTIVSCALKQIQDASIYLSYDFHLPQDDGHFASQQKVYNEVGHEMLEHALEG